MEVLTDQEIDGLLAKLPEWKREDHHGQHGIARTFTTGNFLAGLGFVTRVAVLAEAANHHPDIVLRYPRVTVFLTTHDAGGLTQKDFDLAGQIDRLGA
ncbi:MAG: 4a-hydroxytetrahydrobiopterin dehydratase [Planctomycetes bacterium]|nr:4a-hydroxytetrahydrobiopterin dehydratase [Planctomycetota bacterium]